MMNLNNFSVNEMTLEQQKEISGGFNLNLCALIAGITIIALNIMEYFSN